MSDAKDGGPAFPATRRLGTGMMGEPVMDNTPGMTLRDWFAGQALAGVVAKFGTQYPEDTAGRCYQVADAMIVRRKRHD